MRVYDAFPNTMLLLLLLLLLLRSGQGVCLCCAQPCCGCYCNSGRERDCEEHHGQHQVQVSERGGGHTSFDACMLGCDVMPLTPLTLRQLAFRNLTAA
jgi:hypothetical protein